MPATATIKTRSIQGETLPAATDRLINTILLREGVVDKANNSFKVAQDTGANMQVKVGSGTAYDKAVVEGDNAGQGVFVAEHQSATVTLAVAAADATNPRTDIVVLRVYDDTFDSSGNDYADVEIVEGTPAASPVTPTVPDSAIKLAEIAVGAGVTAITNANITDTRAEAGLQSLAMVNDPWILTGRNSTGTGVAIGTSYGDIVSASVVVPAHWNSYDLEAVASCEMVDSSGLSTGTVVVGSRFEDDDGVFDSIANNLEMEGQNNHDLHPYSQVGYKEGLTTTGTRTVTWRMTRTGNATTADNMTLIVKAIRTS